MGSAPGTTTLQAGSILGLDNVHRRPREGRLVPDSVASAEDV